MQKLFLFVCLACSIQTFAEKKDTLQQSKLILANHYSSYTGYDGRKIGSNQRRNDIYLGYTTNNAWTFSAMDSHWTEVSAFTAVFDVNVAKKIAVSKNSALELGYEHEFVPKHNPFVLPNVLNNDLTANYSIDKKYFLTSLDAGYLFGKGSAYYASVEFQGNLEKDDFLGADYFAIQPGVEFISGTYDVFNKVPTTQITKKKASDRSTGTFDLLDYDFVVPVTYEKGKFTFTFEYHYNIPVAYNSTEIVSPFSYVKLNLDFNFLGGK